MSASNLLAILIAVVFAGCGGKVGDGASNTDGTVAGGYTTAGGATSTGGTTITGGTRAVGGTTITGGTTSTGGTAIPGGAAGADCDGGRESKVDVNGIELRVAKLITVANPNGSSTYQIDATEVTRGQYEDWLATNPPLPPSSDADCGWKSAGSFTQDSSCMTSSSVCQGADCDDHPVVCVDWCAAYYYCAAVGKRLCGRIGGGANRSIGDENSASQWTCACSSGGVNTYPYGNTYQERYCNGFDYWGDLNGTTMPVAMLSKCQTSRSGYCAVYDLSGNVYEWEDSCYDTIHLDLSGNAIKGSPACYVRKVDFGPPLTAPDFGASDPSPAGLVPAQVQRIQQK